MASSFHSEEERPGNKYLDRPGGQRVANVTVLACVGYPTLEDSDHRWIESFRARHDPQASRIRAHFTLVFPVELAAEPVVEHLSVILKNARPIPFVLRRAEPVPDLIASGSPVFLVPEEGRDEIVALHDRLYGGLLRRFLRKDLPFLPHITVGGSATFDPSQRLAAELNRETLAVPGVIEHVDLIEITNEGIKTVVKFALEH
jgi:2'-5' RNA ligase